MAFCAAALLAAHDVHAQAAAGKGFVRLEAIEAKAAPNEHPAAIGAELVRSALGSVRRSGSALRSGGSVFDDRELAEIATPLAVALGKAGPAQDVGFAVFGRHGTFGENSPATVTTGRAFVQAGQLNLILGHLHARYEDPGFGGTLELTPGQRARPVGQVWALSADAAKPVPRRGDWLQFDLAQLAQGPKAAETPAAPVAAPSSRPQAEPASPKTDAGEARFLEIQSRLKTLERLRAEGLVSEDEYRERRRAILQSI